MKEMEQNVHEEFRRAMQEAYCGPMSILWTKKVESKFK